MTQIFIKLLNKGLRSSDFDKFQYQIQQNSSVSDLIDVLKTTHKEDFEVYLEDMKSNALRMDAIVIVNGKMIAAGWKFKMGILSEEVLDARLKDGDTIVFMIPIGGG